MKKIINIAKTSGKIQFITLLIVGLFFLTTGYFLIIPNFAKASALTSVKDVLSTSAPATNSNHTISFTLSTGVTWDAGDTITLEFETGFDLTGLANTDALDYDIVTDTGGTPTEETIVVSGCGATDEIEITSISGQIITFTACGSYTAPPTASGIEIEIGLNATSPSQGDTQIENPAKSAGEGTADIRGIDINGTVGDTGTAYVAIIEGVTVSVTVAESLTFTIDGLVPAGCTGDTGAPAPVVRDFDSSNITAPFGTIINTDKFYVGCQELEVSSNAASGYNVTVEEDTSLHSTTTETLVDDTQCDNTLCDFDTSDTWADPTVNGLGYTCEEGTGAPCPDGIDSFAEYRSFPCAGADSDCDPSSGLEVAQVIMSESTTVSADTVKIHYKISIGTTQSTGETYDNTITYVATSTF